jgi:hypothetical protein
MLPTPENRAKAISAYVGAHVGREMKTRHIGRHKHSGFSANGTEYKYPGTKYGSTRNPWHSVLDETFGGTAVEEARKTVPARVLHDIAAAPHFQAAFRAALGGLTNDTGAYSDQYEGARHWTAEAANALRAKAAEFGVMDQPVSVALPGWGYSSSRPHGFHHDVLDKLRVQRTGPGAAGYPQPPTKNTLIKDILAALPGGAADEAKRAA